MKNSKNFYRSILYLLSGIIFTIIILYGNYPQPARTGNHLFIPPLLEDIDPNPKVFSGELKAQAGEAAFLEGKPTATLGYNGSYLGPTIRVREFDNVLIRLTNALTEPTTIHWHGLVVDPRMDGVFEEYGVVVAPQNEKRYSFPINQPSATLWYHPHTMGKTGKQVYLGLAGLFIIEDAASESLPLPNLYGVNDIPLIIQDRRLSGQGRMPYNPSLPDVLQGFKGDFWLVNGSIQPDLTLPPVWVRFRLLNGSNARFLKLSLDKQAPLYMIASEGGLLEKPLPIASFGLSPAERLEIMADFSKSGGRSFVLTGEDSSGQKVEILTIRILESMSRDLDEQTRAKLRRAELPSSLGNPSAFDQNKVEASRVFELENPAEHAMHMGMMGMENEVGNAVPLTINRRSFDPKRVDVQARVGALEVWRIVSAPTESGMMMPPMLHNFHLHGAQFTVLRVDGKAADPAFSGLKDTVSLWPHREVELLVKFGDYPGKFVFHCHVLEHEDQGMMGVVELVP